MIDTARLQSLIQALPKDTRQKLAKAATPRLSKYIVHAPTPKQRAAMVLNHVREGFYGGAAGGGKSDWLLMEALQYADVPGYSAILFRRTFRDLDLPGALMDRSKDWLSKTDAHWDEQDHRWNFPGGGSLVFGYMEHEDDKRRYQSAEFQFVGFDEGTQFTETQYSFMFSRLRRTAGMAAIPLRMRIASNPGGIGHEWIKRTFVDERQPDRFYIPARVTDNPHLDQESYISNLRRTDPVTAQQMLEGKWEAVPEGKKFKREWVIDRILPARIPVTKAVRFWDFAASVVTKNKRDPDWTVGTLMGLTRQGQIVISDVQRFRGLPEEVEQRVGLTADMDGVRVPVWIEQEPGSSGVNTISHFRRNVLPGRIVKGLRSTGSKEERANVFLARCVNDVFLVGGGAWISAWFNEMEAFPSADWHDDQVDSASGAYTVLTDPKVSGTPGVRVVD